MERLFNAKGELIVSGIHPGKGNTQIPLWADGSNVLFKDDSVKVGPQQSLIFTKPTGLLGNGIISVDNQGSPAVVWGTRRSLFKGISPPLSVNVSGGVTIFNDLDNDSTNWNDTASTLSDVSTPTAPGSSDSMKAEAVGAKFIIFDRDLAAGSTDFTNNVLTFWIYADTTIHGDLRIGDAIQVQLSSVLGGASDWAQFDLPASVLPLANEFFRLEIDTNVTPNVTSGSPDLAAILNVRFAIVTDSVQVAPATIFIDELGLGGFYTGTDLDRWSIVQFGQSILASNGVDPIQYLASITSGLFQNINDAGANLPTTFRANILHKLGPFVIAFNTDNDNTEARWCSEDNVLEWLPIPRNSARDINLRDMNSDIKAVTEFGDSLMVIGHGRAHVFQFIGAPLFFGAKKLIDGIGAVGKNAVTEGGRLIYGFAANGIYVTDGTTKQYIDEPDIHKFIYEDEFMRYDTSRAELTAIWDDTNDGEIYFSYPTIDGRGTTISFNPVLQVWAKHDYWRTAAAAGNLWDAPILLSEAGDIWIQNEEGAGSTFEVAPLGMRNLLKFDIGMGDGAMGESFYGGENVYP